MNSKIIQAFFTSGFGPLQHKPGQPGGASESFSLDPGRLNLAGSVGRSLPEAVLRKMEQVFKADFSDVRIHQGPQAGSIGAHAFTMGSSIYFAPGQYSPDTARGQQLLGHELTHVLQQRSGRVRTPQGGGMMVVNDHALEAEADRMGVIAASFRPLMQAKMAAPIRPSVQAKPASHKLVVGAYMHQGAAGSGVPPDLAGHAFVSLQGPTGKHETWGFSPANFSRYNPQKDIGKLRAGVPGVVHRDDQAFSKPGVKTRSFNLTPAQAKAAMAKIDEYKTRQYKFSAQSRQCTTFASDVMRAAHVDGGVSGKLPGDLYRKVGVAQAKFSAGRYQLFPPAPRVCRPLRIGMLGQENSKIGNPAWLIQRSSPAQPVSSASATEAFKAIQHGPYKESDCGDFELHRKWVVDPAYTGVIVQRVARTFDVRLTDGTTISGAALDAYVEANSFPYATEKLYWELWTVTAGKVSDDNRDTFQLCALNPGIGSVKNSTMGSFEILGSAAFYELNPAQLAKILAAFPVKTVNSAGDLHSTTADPGGILPSPTGKTIVFRVTATWDSSFDVATQRYTGVRGQKSAQTSLAKAKV